MDKQSIANIGQEFSTADFGDQRLNNRLVRIVNSLASKPDWSFPQASNSIADLEATYRFLGNPKVIPEKILAPHIRASAQRTRNCERVVIAHDTTNFIFGGKSRKEEIGWLYQGNLGFMGHFALAMDRGELVSPLGIVGIDTLFRNGEPKRLSGNDRRGKKDKSRESLRWWKLVEEVEGVLPSTSSPVHVMDREADDYELLSTLIENQCRFVIRARHNRTNCKKLDEVQYSKLFDLLERKEPIACRVVQLGNRVNPIQTRPGHYRDRSPRSATLSISAIGVKVPRSTHLPKELPGYLFLNCVHVYEKTPPKGEEAVDWKLVTTEPIDEVEDILTIVDDYRSRWMIEEYFKALKTGCGFQKRQVETRATILNTLAVLVPIAHQLLFLRTASRSKPERPANQILSKSQIDLLKAVVKKPLPDHPTAHEVLLAIARLGGHIPNNGSPGWQVLGRGMEKLLIMETAWLAAKQEM